MLSGKQSAMALSCGASLAGIKRALLAIRTHALGPALRTTQTGFLHTKAIAGPSAGVFKGKGITVLTEMSNFALRALMSFSANLGHALKDARLIGLTL
jgi:hypothetical protein